MSQPLTKVLVVEDDPDDFLLLKFMFHRQRSYGEHMFYLERAATLAEAFERLRVDDWNFFIVDYKLAEGGNGLQFIQYLYAQGIPVPALLLSGDEDLALHPDVVDLIHDDRIRFLAKEDLNWDCMYAGICDLLSQSLRVLIVEDDPDDAFLIRGMLEDFGHLHFDVDLAATIEQAVERIEARQYHSVIIDYHIGARLGLELLGDLQRLGRDPLLMLCTGRDDLIMDRNALKLMGRGRCRFVSKNKLNRNVVVQTLLGTSRLAIWSDSFEASRPLQLGGPDGGGAATDTSRLPG